MGSLPPGLENVFQQAYVSDLLSYPLDRLHKEPDLLRVESERISRQIQEVSITHYRAFITAAESLQSITKEVSEIDQHLEMLISEVPKLTAGCNEFMDSAHQILEKRQLNRTLLANHGTLLDLLEIPQLMDTCVRNGNYDEALDLEAFVLKLATMHMNLPVIQSLVADVRQNTQSLLAQLLHKLRSNVPAHDCINITGYIRRLGVFSNQELRLQFLKCREAWITGVLEDLDKGNPDLFLKGLTDCHRVNIFDVVTQYRTLFSDETSEASEGGLLFGWLMHRVTCHLDLLQELLPSVTNGESLAVILNQSMQCGLSLGCVGVDFRGLLPPIFETCVYNLFVRNMSLALRNFQHMMDTHHWVFLPSSRDASEDKDAPPQSLLDHPPVGVFVNGVLGALKDLRPCAPLSLSFKLASELEKALQSVSESFLRFNESRFLKSNESTLFNALCRAFLDVASPYCAASFARCYPGTTIDTNRIGIELRKLLSNSSSAPVPVLENGKSSSRPQIVVEDELSTKK